MGLIISDMTLDVFSILESQNASHHDDGLLLYEKIKEALGHAGEETIEVDFSEVKRCTTLFLNASFGKVLSELGEEQMRRKVVPIRHTQILKFDDKYNDMWDNTLNAKNYQAYRVEAYA